MYDSSYYQNKRKSEIMEQNKNRPKPPKTSIANDTYIIIIAILILIVSLFVLQWKALESGRISCESRGGEWHSASTGKITTTRCDGIK